MQQERHELEGMLPPDRELLGTPLVERVRQYIRDMHEALGVTDTHEPDPLAAALKRSMERVNDRSRELGGPEI